MKYFVCCSKDITMHTKRVFLVSFQLRIDGLPPALGFESNQNYFDDATMAMYQTRVDVVDLKYYDEFLKS